MLEAVTALYQGGERPCLIANACWSGRRAPGLAAAVGIVRD
ncbi:MAG: hypothetical protein R3D25_04620 [Geminicoccaceae bacterium]